MVENIVACSRCFHDIGLRKEAEKIGIKDNSVCPKCGSQKGMKLTKEQLIKLCEQYFGDGSYIKTEFGGSNYLTMCESSTSDDIKCYNALKRDIKFLSNTFNIGIFYYGPQEWKIGRNNWMDDLVSTNNEERECAVEKVAKRCFTKVLKNSKRFYRIRTNLKSDFTSPIAYDAPPIQRLEDGRMNLEGNTVLYGAFNVETCIHETRVAIDDEIYIATLNPTKELKFLDFCRIKAAKNEPTPFEQLGLAISQIFLAGTQSYRITQAFSKYAFEHGYDGVIYPSYFNSVRDKKFRNIVIFGHPIAEGKIKVISIDRINLTKVKYDFTFGPVTDEQ